MKYIANDKGFVLYSARVLRDQFTLAVTKLRLNILTAKLVFYRQKLQLNNSYFQG